MLLVELLLAGQVRVCIGRFYIYDFFFIFAG